MGSIMLKCTLPFKKSAFDNTDTNIQWGCVHLLHIVHLKSKLYLAVSYFDKFWFYRQSYQIKYLPNISILQYNQLQSVSNIFFNLFKFALKHKATKYAYFKNK